MSAREAYIAGRSGGKRPPKQTSPSSTQRNTQQDREQKAFDAGAAERSREQRIKNAMKREKDRDPNIGGLTNEELNTIQTLSTKTGKNPYNVSTEGGITTLGEETTRRQTPSIGEGITNFVDNFTIAGKLAPGLNEFLDDLVGKNIDGETLTKENALAILGARLKRGDTGKLGTKLEDELFGEGGEYFDLVDKIFGDEAKELGEKTGRTVTPEELLRDQLTRAFDQSDPDITFRFNEEKAKEKFENIPATTGGKVDLASLPTTGPNAIKDPELRRKIFDARADLNRDDRNPFTGTKDQGGIPSVNTGGGQADTDTDTTDPGFPDYRFRDLGIAPFASYNPEDVMVDYSDYQATQGPLGSITNAKNGGIMNAADGTMVSISMTPLPITNIQEIKMDKQKYRDNMMREEISRTSMGKGVDLAPNFGMDA